MWSTKQWIVTCEGLVPLNGIFRMKFDAGQAALEVVQPEEILVDESFMRTLK